MRLLVVGSRIEAYMALEVLLGCAAVEKVVHLPVARPEPDGSVFSQRTPFPSFLGGSARELPSCALRDRWGKKVLDLPLNGFRAHLWEPPTLTNEKLETLAFGLDLRRTRQTQEGLQVEFSDGSEQICEGVLFADGPSSRAVALATRPATEPDANSVSCWSFFRSDLLDLKQWEYRWAIGKSVEQLPLPGGKVRVSFRFRSPYGARLGPSDLKEFFSEFGADMEALFEDVQTEQIEHREECNPFIDFNPLPGCLALGESALARVCLDAFDWRNQLTQEQLTLLAHHLESGQGWDAEVLARKSRSAAEPLLRAEEFLRSALHYDNTLLRPLRDFLIGLAPSGLLRPRLKERLLLT